MRRCVAVKHGVIAIHQPVSNMLLARLNNVDSMISIPIRHQPSYWAKALTSGTDVNTDSKLSEQARALDPDALGQVYDAYFERLYRYAYRFVDCPETAQDIASETLHRLLEALYKGSGPDDLAHWLFRVAHNLAIDTIRKRPANGIISLEPDIAADSAENTETLAESHLEQERIRFAMRQLTDDQQNVVILKYMEGYSNDEISNLIHKPSGAIKSLQHRALGALRHALSKPRRDNIRDQSAGDQL